ncbi:MAG TPA: hypothetical protein ENK55_02875 [Actinobacteria bacterium]|nr:hypothetical protein [Actinomycetota bacterium]
MGIAAFAAIGAVGIGFAFGAGVTLYAAAVDPDVRFLPRPVRRWVERTEALEGIRANRDARRLRRRIEDRRR